MRALSINRIAWVFRQAELYAGRLPALEANAERLKVMAAKEELEKYLHEKLRYQE